MKRSDLTFRAVHGLAGWAGAGLAMVGALAVLDAVEAHFGRPVALFVAVCAIVVCVGMLLEMEVPAERAEGDGGGRGR